MKRGLRRFANGRRKTVASVIENTESPAGATFALIGVSGFCSARSPLCGQDPESEVPASRRALQKPRENMEEKFFGHPVLRKEGREKVTGRARYVDDLDFPDMLHGVTVRSISGKSGRPPSTAYGRMSKMPGAL